MIENPCSLSAQEIANQLHSNLEKGLGRGNVQKRLEKYRPNQIPKEGPRKRWRVLIDQLFDPIIYILAVAAVLAV